MDNTKKSQTTAASINAKIKALDAQIVDLVEARIQLIADRQSSEGPEFSSGFGTELDAKTLRDGMGQVLLEIDSFSRQFSKSTRVAYLGPQFSYSFLAAVKQFGSSQDFLPKGSITAVFESVSGGDAKFGVVPLENSTDGRIADTLTMFAKHPVSIYREVHLPIRHCLISQGTLDDLRQIRSKAQALSQCREWLAKNLPRTMDVVSTQSSSEAAEYAARKGRKSVAAIACREAATALGLNVLAEGIEDQKGNLTRFAIIVHPESSGVELLKKTGRDKTSLMFEVPHQPGALADVMNVFKRAKLNLTWIESFPKPAVFSEYLFFVELQGHRDEVRVRNAFANLEKKTESLTVLGSYPEFNSA